MTDPVRPSTPPPPTPAFRASPPLSVAELAFRIGPLLALLVLAGVMALVSPDFRKPENPLNILNNNAYVGIVAVGMTYVMILGGIDLSVGSMVALLGGAGIMAMTALAPTTPAVADAASGSASAATSGEGLAMLTGGAIMVAGGLVLGLINGGVIVLGRVAPFIATLGTMAIFRSLVLAWSDAGEIRVPATLPSFRTLGTGGVELFGLQSSRGRPLMVTYPTLVFLGLAIVAQIALWKSVLGRRIFAVGDNPIAARYAGVSLRATTLAAYAFAGLCCGIAALLASSRLNSISSAQAGKDYELDAIAAVVIGGTSMRGGRGAVLGTLIGVLILGVISNALNLLNVSPHLQGAAKGAIVIAAVLLQRNRVA